MNSQDIITYTQEIIKVIENDETVEALKDETLLPVMSFLLKKPMTISDLIRAFRKRGHEKSDKTIYRYLHSLIKVKLVAKAGKRIISITEDELKSETLYMRTAKAYILPEVLKHDHEGYEKGFCPVFDTARLLLRPVLDGDTLNSDCFQKLLFKIDQQKDEQLIELFKNLDDETVKAISELKQHDFDHCLIYTNWVALATKIDLKKEIANCR